jgi:hypothetical protein
MRTTPQGVEVRMITDFTQAQPSEKKEWQNVSRLFRSNSLKEGAIWHAAMRNW